MVPLWGSPGEWMQPADSVDYYGHSFMEAVRTKRFPKFASGGPIDPAQWNAFGAGAGSAYATNIDAFQVMGMKHPPQLPKWTPPPPPSFSSAGGSSGFSPSGGVARWGGTALGVMHQLGLPDWILSKVQRRMQQESGGNPDIVNKWDINWQQGHPSVGLMQPIRKTFQSYAGPYLGTGPFSYGVSVNPAANIYAGLNYAGHRYGSHGGFLGGVIYGMDKPGGYASGGLIGYGKHRVGRFDNGGVLEDGMLGLNTSGKPENVRSTNQEDALLDALKGVKSSVDQLKTMGIRGVLYTKEGAFLGEVEAALGKLEHAAGF